jgi:hypothetical protein
MERETLHKSARRMRVGACAIVLAGVGSMHESSLGSGLVRLFTASGNADLRTESRFASSVL